MAVPLVNPYLTLAELKAELKIAETDTDKDDALNTAINKASRWVDDYRGRDYYGHDHRGPVGIAGVMAPAPGTLPLVLTEFDARIYEGVLFSPVGEVRELYGVSEGAEALGYGTGFQYRVAPQPLEPIIWRVGARWSVGALPEQGLTLRGKFGRNQWRALPGVFVGLPAFSSLVLNHAAVEKQNALVFPKVVLNAGAATVTIYSDAGYTLPIAQSPVDYTQPAANVALMESNGSGYSGTFSAGTMAADIQGSAYLQNDVLDPSIVPTDLPDIINLCAKLVAAALSGHNRKEVVGLDGQKQEIYTNTIPKTVFEILGRRPVLV